jgi:hypothetical protein
MEPAPPASASSSSASAPSASASASATASASSASKKPPSSLHRAKVKGKASSGSGSSSGAEAGEASGALIRAFRTAIVQFPDFVSDRTVPLLSRYFFCLPSISYMCCGVQIHSDYVDCVRWCGDLVLSHSVGPAVVLWKPAVSSAGHTRSVVLHTYNVDDCPIWFVKFALDPAHRLLAMGDKTGVWRLDLLLALYICNACVCCVCAGNLSVWDMADGKCNLGNSKVASRRMKLTHNQPRSLVRQVAFSHDSAYVHTFIDPPSLLSRLVLCLVRFWL